MEFSEGPFTAACYGPLFWSVCLCVAGTICVYGQDFSTDFNRFQRNLKHWGSSPWDSGWASHLLFGIFWFLGTVHRLRFVVKSKILNKLIEKSQQVKSKTLNKSIGNSQQVNGHVKKILHGVQILRARL
ncbi:unnamed protein product [Discosporangium mesarthrocarpum]